MPETVILLGSSRSHGNTYKIVKYLRGHIDTRIINLKDYTILPYDYEHKNRSDDFIPLIKEIVKSYELIIFATPIYWYSMSGTMKIFFDRLSDCLQIEKETGRKLRGKSMAAISCGSEPSPTLGFFTPFRLSADYLGMDYLGDVHTWIDGDDITAEVQDILSIFAKAITK